MLQSLRISHFAIIDALEVRFDGGFNVLTGETGAGKSILIDALHLILGGRAHADVVRTGHDEAVVEAVFEPLDGKRLDAQLTAQGLPACEDGMLLVRRTVHREGRSRAFLNGAQATAAQVQQVVRGLVDISSQHEHTSLLDPSKHLDFVDQFAGLGPQVATYRAAFDKLSEAHRKLKSLKLSESERARRIDYLTFQLDEIEKLDPSPGEDVALAAERQKLGSAERLRNATSGAERLVYSQDGSATELVGKALVDLEKAMAFDPLLQQSVTSLSEALDRLNDVGRDLGKYARTVHDDPSRLAELDDRLEAIKRLARKHGGDLAGILKRRDEMKAELKGLTHHEEELAEAEKVRLAAFGEAKKLADGLTAARTKAAKAFAQVVVERLADLEMKRTIFEVVLARPGGEAEDAIDAGDTEASDPKAVEAKGVDAKGSASKSKEKQGDPVRLTPRGQDVAECLLSPNPGEEPRSLARIASGGELSRVMLAIKRVLADLDPVETYVFDEVDAGIGGATGEVVGRMIREVARDRQVLCITHLPQIAAYAESHYQVAKFVKDGRTQSSVTRVEDGEPRHREIARMLSGHVTASSLAHAEELVAKGFALGKEKGAKKAAKVEVAKADVVSIESARKKSKKSA